MRIPAHIIRPHYAQHKTASPWKNFIPILDKHQQKRLGIACQLAKEILQFASQQIHIGQTTAEIDRLVHDEIIRCGAYPSPLHYSGFPKSICTSVNDTVVHGIPDDRALEDGDIINLDVSVFINGFHGDTSQTFKIGNVSEESTNLIRITNEALNRSIESCFPGAKFSVIGDIIETICCEAGMSVVKEYTGHGIGEEFHCLPYVMHTRNEEDTEMLPGMAFTIEPAVCLGNAKLAHWDDGWTIVTEDGSRSAQAEHTLLVTNDSVKILT